MVAKFLQALPPSYLDGTGSHASRNSTSARVTNYRTEFGRTRPNRISIGSGPKIFENVRPRHLGRGVEDLLETHLFPHGLPWLRCRTCVIQGETVYERSYGDPPFELPSTAKLQHG